MTGIERSDAVAVKGFEGGGRRGGGGGGWLREGCGKQNGGSSGSHKSRRGEGSDQLSLDHGGGIGIYL